MSPLDRLTPEERAELERKAQSPEIQAIRKWIEDVIEGKATPEEVARYEKKFAREIERDKLYPPQEWLHD